jgi:hypothetical protein
MTNPLRIALYLRVIAGEVAEAKGSIIRAQFPGQDRETEETAATLDSISRKLRDLADTFEAQTVDL